MVSNKVKQKSAFFRSLFSVFVITSVLLISSTVEAKKYYVNNSVEYADDSNPGTFESPWRTIHKANRTVVAGDTVIVMAGVYHDWIFPDNCGTPENWIVYKSYPEHAAVLNGRVDLSDAICEGAEWTEDSSYGGNVWTIELITNAFLEARRDGERMPFPFPYTCDTLEFDLGRSFVDFTGRLFVWLEENDVPSNHSWEVSLKSGVWLIGEIGCVDKYLSVEDFIIEEYGFEGVAIQKNHVKIINNIVRNNGRAGIAAAFCNYVFVENNDVYENCTGVGFSQGIAAYKAMGREIYFIGNVSHDNFDGDDPEHCGTDGAGFILDSSRPNGGAVFINNVAYNNMGSGFGVYQSNYGYFINNTSFHNGLKNIFGKECHIIGTVESSSNNLIFRNNIFAGGGGRASVISIKYPYANLPQNVVLDHNLYYLPNADSSSEIFEFTIRSALGDTSLHLNLEEFQNLVLPTDTGNIELNWGEGSIVASPCLINWREGGFKLCSTSPAIDNGSPDLAPSTDFYGTPRPQGNGFDMGAYEYDEGCGVATYEDESEFSVSAYPTPFNGQTTIVFSLKNDANVNLVVYDIIGRKVKELLSEFLRKGKYFYKWNINASSDRQLSSGVYLLRLETDFGAKIFKVVYLK